MPLASSGRGLRDRLRSLVARIGRRLPGVRAPGTGLLALLSDRARSTLTRPAVTAFRAEAFGGVVQIARPPALVFVDRALARALGHDGGARWARPEADGVVDRAPLSAPLEAHLTLTARCGVGCAACYVGATPGGRVGEWGLEEWRRAVDHLADQGVFHLALGGGESATLPWLGELAEHARRRGLIPNLTTSGLEGLPRLLEIAELFGQIHVSIDGVGATYAAVRGHDGFAAADRALRALRARKVEVGLNCVVARPNRARLGEILDYARARGLASVELLRLKPAGRGAAAYARLATTPDENAALFAELPALARRARVRVVVDCGMVPFLAWRGASPRALARLGVIGCGGGDLLAAADARGRLAACSYAPVEDATIDGLGEAWARPDSFASFRRWRRAPEPCAACAHLGLCRGGCRAVSLHLAGSLDAPDPECPRVRAWSGSR
jgi:radical SAM protein with 4Fe4S-binding SPASM domain